MQNSILSINVDCDKKCQKAHWGVHRQVCGCMNAAPGPEKEMKMVRKYLQKVITKSRKLWSAHEPVLWTSE